MKNRFVELVIACFALGSILAGVVYATSNYTYKRGEYVIIAQGNSPNGRYSIASHGEGEAGYVDFHLMLRAEPGHRRIGRLTEIGDSILDTGASAYRADWSPDSRYVAVSYRSGRHSGQLLLYRIVGNRAILTLVPNLFAVAKGDANLRPKEVQSTYFSMTWLGANRFRLHSERGWNHLTNTDLHRRYNRFFHVEDDFRLIFSADAVGTIDANRHIHIVSLTPGSFD